MKERPPLYILPALEGDLSTASPKYPANEVMNTFTEAKNFMLTKYEGL